MTHREIMSTLATTPLPPPPKFVRKNGKGYEYGSIKVDHVDRTKDKHVVEGKAPTLAEAMTLNGMEVLNGHVKEGF